MTSTTYKNINGKTEWRNEQGQLHRENGPAVEYANGAKEWWLNGKKHRKGAPAVEHPNGRTEYHLNGQLHREDGPAIEWPNGDQWWFVRGRLHRLDGPAVKREDMSEEWYKKGKRHRENGPAIKYHKRFGKDKEYWWNGKTGEEVKQKVKENIEILKAKRQKEKMLNFLKHNENISDKLEASLPQKLRKI